MGSLATYLQAAFVEQCPPGWICHTEAHLPAKDQEQVLGYSWRVDPLMKRTDALRRLRIKFEVSRADPVAPFNPPQAGETKYRGRTYQCPPRV